MLITKKHIYTILVILCIILINVFSLVLVLTTEFGDSKTIVIDAGHGGIDGGVSIGTVVEADLTLQLAFELKEILEKADYKVVLTRDSKLALGDGKKADMQARREVIDSCNPVMMISLHINKFADSNVRGVRVFYDDTNKHKDSAERMQSVLNSRVNEVFVGRSDFKSSGGDFYITKCSEVTSLIIECGFISSPQDRELLLNPQYRIKLCGAIADGVVSMTSNSL